MLVSNYEFGRIVVDNRSFKSDIILSNDGIINEGWWRREGHRVTKYDIREILEYSPEVVIFGTGYYGVVKVDEEVGDLFKSRGVRVEKFKSAEAVKRFNELAKQGKRVVLAIHLTC